MCKKDKCATKYCKRKQAGGSKYCNTCKSRRWRKDNPVKYGYFNLKSNAKRRGKAFDITYEEFEKFCYATDYIAGKGRTRESYSIDRIDNNKGYTLDNIRIMTVSANSRKGTKLLHYDWRTQEALVVHHRPETDVDNFF